jgi:hypothetical protein
VDDTLEKCDVLTRTGSTDIYIKEKVGSASTAIGWKREVLLSG